MRLTGLAAAALLVAGLSLAPAAVAFDHAHTAFDGVLEAHVDAGQVDYAAIKADPAALQAYLASLADVGKAELEAWESDQQLAFWINAYNAFVIQSIIENYPLERRGIKGLAFPASSIWQIPGVWKGIKRRAAGREVALDDVEHGIIRPEFGDPRIHVALVCAAKSCPPLRSEAYVADRLDAQLDEQARQFLRDSENGLVLEPDSRRIRISRIFKWFGEDFVLPEGVEAPLAGRRGQRGIVYWLRAYADDAARAALSDPDNRVSYLKYDWELNDVP
ncbi:MAG: DUF547 domain-containing protein [Pseudomonadota bacterium]